MYAMGARTTASQPLLESRPPLYMKDDIGSCSPGACQTSEMFLIAINKLVQGMGGTAITDGCLQDKSVS